MRLGSVRKKHQKPLVSRRWRSIFSRKSLFFSFFGGSLLWGSITGMNWGVAYSQQHLAPEVTRLLQESLDRPVHLGQVEQVSLTQIRLGSSVIPATATDRDQVTVEAIEIQFNPIAALWQRQVHLTVTLIRPTAFFDQDDAGNWSNLEIELAEDDQIEVTQIRLRDATIILMPGAKALKSLVNNPEAEGIPIAPRQVTFQHIDLNFVLADPDQPLKFNLTGQSRLGGSFSLRGEVTPAANTAAIRLETDRLAVTALNPFLPATARLDRGRLSSRLQVQVDAAGTIAFNGKANLNDLAVQVDGEPNLFTQTTGQFRFQGQTIAVSHAHTVYGQIPFDDVHGTIHLQNGLDLKGRVQALGIPAFLSTFDLDVPFATKGRLQTTDLQATGPIDGAIFSGTVHDVEPVQLDRVDIAAVEGRFTYDTGADRLNLHQINLFPKAGGVIASRGLAILGEADKGEPDDLMLDLEVKDLPSDAITQLYALTVPGIRFGRLNAKAKVAVFNEQPQVQLQWQLDQSTYPAQGQVTLAQDRLRLQDTQIQIADQIVRVEGELADDRWQLMAQGADLPLQSFLPRLPGEMTGAVKLRGEVDRPLASTEGELRARIYTPDGTVSTDGTIQQGRWQGQIQSHGVALSGFSPDLPGVLTGTLNLAGTLDNLHPAAIGAQGQIQLSEGISRQHSFLNQPLSAAFRWNGDRLEIQQAKTAGLDLSGWIAAQLEDWQHPAITGSDLNVQLQGYDLATLPLHPSLPVTPQGTADFRGRITGTPIAPHLSGNLQLHQLSIHQLAFEPLLSGDVNYSPRQGLHLNLRGKQDQIALKLDDRHRLNALTIRLGEAMAEATLRSDVHTRADRLLATVQNFPLEKLHLSPAAAWGTVRGLLSGRFNVMLADDPIVMGEIAIDRPALGSINAAPAADHGNDRFVGNFRYADRTLALTDGNLQLGTGQYRIAGQYRLTGSPTPGNPSELTGHLTTDSGNLQDFATLVSPAAWQTVWTQLGIPSLPASPLLPQFLVAQATPSQPSQPIAPLPASPPALSDLQGTFSTQLNLQHSQNAGLAIEFNLQGQNWRWREFGIQQVSIGNSRFNGQHLALSPLQLRGLVYAPADQPAQEFDASVTFAGEIGDRQSGQFHAAAIPAALLGRLFNLPIPLAGSLQATATLSGSTTNPQVNGTVETTGIRLNAKQVKDLQVMFQYNNHQFQVNDWRLME